MAKDNVHILEVWTTLDIPAKRVLEQALEADLESVIVIGRNKEGIMYRAASKANGGEVLWDLEQAKLALIGVCFGGDCECS